MLYSIGVTIFTSIGVGESLGLSTYILALSHDILLFFSVFIRSGVFVKSSTLSLCSFIGVSLYYRGRCIRNVLPLCDSRLILVVIFFLAVNGGVGAFFFPQKSPLSL